MCVEAGIDCVLGPFKKASKGAACRQCSSGKGKCSLTPNWTDNTGMTGKLSVMLGLCHHKKTLAQVELDGVRPEDIEWPPKVPVEWQGAVKNEMKKPEVSKRRTINAAYFNSQLSKKAGKAKQKAPLRAIDKSDHEESDSGEEEEQEDGEHVEEQTDQQEEENEEEDNEGKSPTYLMPTYLTMTLYHDPLLFR